MKPNLTIFIREREKAEAEYQAALRHLKTAERIYKVAHMARVQTEKAYDFARGIWPEPKRKPGRPRKQPAPDMPVITGSMTTALLGL